MRRTFWLTAGAVGGVWAYRKVVAVAEESRERGASATAVAAFGKAVHGTARLAEVARGLSSESPSGTTGAWAGRVANIGDGVVTAARRTLPMVDLAAGVDAAHRRPVPGKERTGQSPR